MEVVGEAGGEGGAVIKLSLRTRMSGKRFGDGGSDWLCWRFGGSRPGISGLNMCLRAYNRLRF